MPLNQNLLLSAFSGGGRSTRYADFVVVTLPAGAFVATAMEFQQAQTWARARASMGNAQRDRSAFMDRFETLLARSGSGVATRGNRQALSRLVSGMLQGGLQLEGWSVPTNLNESVEIKKKAAPAESTPPAAVSSLPPARG